MRILPAGAPVNTSGARGEPRWAYTAAMTRIRLLAAVAVLAAAGPAAAADFDVCLAGLKQSALDAGVPPAVVAQALDGTTASDKVLAASQVQPEFKTPIWDYMGFLVDDQRVADGRAMMAKNDATLRAVQARYGVDRYVVAAVWGVETDFGREVGSYFLPASFATLVCAVALASRR